MRLFEGGLGDRAKLVEQLLRHRGLVGQRLRVVLQLHRPRVELLVGGAELLLRRQVVEQRIRLVALREQGRRQVGAGGAAGEVGDELGGGALGVVGFFLGRIRLLLELLGDVGLLVVGALRLGVDGALLLGDLLRGRDLVFEIGQQRLDAGDLGLRRRLVSLGCLDVVPAGVVDEHRRTGGVEGGCGDADRGNQSEREQERSRPRARRPPVCDAARAHGPPAGM